MSDSPVRPLTPRQWQVAELIREGFTDKQIAAELGLAERTVRVHIARIRTKWALDAARNTRVQIARRMSA